MSSPAAEVAAASRGSSRLISAGRWVSSSGGMRRARLRRWPTCRAGRGATRCLRWPVAVSRRRQLDLAHHLGVDRTVMTYLLDDLEQAGLVERQPDPTDRRARLIVLTGGGRDMLVQLETRLAEAEAVVLGTLSEDERRLFRMLLQRVAAHGRLGDHPEDVCGLAEVARRRAWRPTGLAER